MRKTVLDLIWGFIAFAVVFAASFLTREHQDIRSFTLATGFAFFGAAFHRAKARYGMLWLTALLVALGGIAPVVIMNRLRFAFTGSSFLVSFLLMSIFTIVSGVVIQWIRERGQTMYAVTLACLSSITVFVTVFVVIPHWMESSAYRSVNQEVSPFLIKGLNGKNASSEEWKGHVVILAFWATWCTPCQAELPQIAALQARFHDNPNVLVLAVNAGNHGETPSKAQAYLIRRRLTLNVAIDSFGVPPGEDSWGPGAKSMGVDSLPALYILDRSGRLRVIHLGYDPSERLVESLSDKVNNLL